MLWLLIYGLATYRVSILMVEEPGPFNIFERLRYRFGVRWDEYSQQVSDGSFLADLFTCVWCLSVWVGIFFTIVSKFESGIFLAMPFALSAIAIILKEFSEWLGQ